MFQKRSETGDPWQLNSLTPRACAEALSYSKPASSRGGIPELRDDVPTDCDRAQLSLQREETEQTDCDDVVNQMVSPKKKKAMVYIMMY